MNLNTPILEQAPASGVYEAGLGWDEWGVRWALCPLLPKCFKSINSVQFGQKLGNVYSPLLFSAHEMKYLSIKLLDIFYYHIGGDSETFFQGRRAIVGPPTPPPPLTLLEQRFKIQAKWYSAPPPPPTPFNNNKIIKRFHIDSYDGKPSTTWLLVL